MTIISAYQGDYQEVEKYGKGKVLTDTYIMLLIPIAINKRYRALYGITKQGACRC